jgi:hypothetical protein
MKNYLVAAIKSLRPTAEFSFKDDDYSTIKWDILEGDAPSELEINAEIAKLKANDENAVAAKAQAKAAIAERLGLTETELAILLG